MKHRVTILTDSPDWCQETEEGLKRQGWEVRVIDLRHFDWTASEPFADPGVVLNRIAARPDDENPALLTRAQDLLRAMEWSGIPCVNGAVCHAIGASKALQASLFSRVGVSTPWTQVVSRQGLEKSIMAAEVGGPFLVKPNAGGRGRGISSPETVTEETYAPDGVAVLQQRIESADGLIHRVEMLGGEVLYQADAPLEAGTYDYCLGGKEAEVSGLTRVPPREIVANCRQVSKAASLDLGSIEYLIDESGEPQFIDLNPVSSLVPDACTRLGFDPLEKLTALLSARMSDAG